MALSFNPYSINLIIFSYFIIYSTVTVQQNLMTPLDKIFSLELSFINRIGINFGVGLNK